jgi:hypothetical protein
MDPREERLGRNEIFFREVNERIEEVAGGLGIDNHVFEFVCECLNLDCTLRLPLTISMYEQARAKPDQFIVAPGHEMPEIEDVIERGEGFQIVQKRGEAADVAEERDPRS